MKKVGTDIVKRFVHRKILGGDYLIPIHIIPDNFVKIDRIGAIFWKALASGDSLDATTEIVAKRFGLDKKQARRDVEKFIEDIQNEKDATEIHTQSEDILHNHNKPLSGSIELTGRCNLLCFHCYAVGERGKIGLKTQQVFELLDELKKNGCLYMQLTGGECTLHPGFVEIYEHCRIIGLVPTVSTNATMITEKILNVFQQYPPWLVKVSLYGADAATHEGVTRVKGSFARTIQNVKLLKQAGVRVMFSAMLFRDTLNKRRKMQQLANSLDVPVHFYSQLIPTLNNKMGFAGKILTKMEAKKLPPNAELEFRPLEEKKTPLKTGHYDCSAGTRSFHIDAEGKLFMCKVERTMGEEIVGKDFEKSWALIGKHARSVLKTPGQCRRCELRSSCQVCPPKLALARRSGFPHLYCGL